MKRNLFYVFIIVAIILSSTTLVLVQAAEEAYNRAEVDVAMSWGTFTEEDSVSNVDLTWSKNWYFRIFNLADETEDAILNPKITVETPLELSELWPDPTISGPPTYEWTYAAVPEGFYFFVGGSQEESITEPPRFSASRTVSPEKLVETSTVQEVVVTFTLEEPLPAEVNEVGIFIGYIPIVGPGLIQPLVDYTLLYYDGVEGWESFAFVSGVEWYILSPQTTLSPSEIVGITYEFRAVFQAVKSASLVGSPISKPDVTVIWRKLEWEAPETGTSVIVNYPYEDITVTFQADNELQWSKIISSSYRFLSLWPIVTPIVGTEPPFYTLSILRLTLRSNADLHVYDSAGRHVGLNYETGEVEIEIPNATYERNAEQVITVPEPTSGGYRVVLVGTSTGPYELIIDGATDTETFLTESYLGWIETGETHESTVTVPETVGALEISPPEEKPSPVLVPEFSMPLLVITTIGVALSLVIKKRLVKP